MTALLKDQELIETLELCAVDSAVWCQTMFPTRFHRPFSSHHRKMFRVLDDPTKQKIVIKAHRGCGKTSILHLGAQSKAICFRDSKFIVPVSCTATAAVMQSENLKRELTSNEAIKMFFPEGVKTETFAKDMWITSTGTMVFPRGRGQQVRGNLYKDYRPDLILVDDFEDKESVMNEEQRTKHKEWFFTDLMGSVDRSSSDWRIIVIGTILHEDSLLANLCEDPSWTVIDIPLCDEYYNPTWPEFMSKKDIVALVEDYRRQGLIDGFYQEYMNQIISTEDSPIKRDMFQYYDEAKDCLWMNKSIENMVLVDPAKTVSRKADDSAIVGVGVDISKQTIYVRDIIAGRFHADEIYEHTIAMAKRLKARIIGLEVTSLHEHITFPFINELRRRGLVFDVVELKAKDKKEHRVRELVPFYRMGLIKHNKAVTGPLEAQLISFPRSKRWDIMDALAYAPVVMATHGQYMFADDEGDKYPSKDEEEEWKMLEKEDELDELTDKWMIA